MDKTIFITLLILAALAMPAWIAWRKSNKRPWLVGWLLVVGLLILPFGLTVWLHPEWLNHPVPFLAKYLVLMAGLLSLCALGGGLVYLLAPLVFALLLAVSNAFKHEEWQGELDEDDDEGISTHDAMYGHGTIYREQLREAYERGEENTW